MPSELKATHQCTICGAHWRQLDDFRWNLRSKECGPCCDNVPMGDQIEALEDVAPWAGPLTAEEQGLIDDAWQTHKAATPPPASANERTAAMDALIAESADLYDAPASADALGEVERVMAAMQTADGSCYARGIYRDSRRYWESLATAALSAMSPAGEVERLQSRVQPWLLACFGAEIAGDTLERTDRFVEEALELAQTNPAFTAERAHVLVDYVFGRPVGEPSQEVGGVMITLAALCLASGLDMHEAGETELARIWTKVDAIRAKQAAKPTGSALPIATAALSAMSPAGEVEKIVAWLRSRADDIAPPETEGSDPLWTVHAFVHGMANQIECGDYRHD